MKYHNEFFHNCDLLDFMTYFGRVFYDILYFMNNFDPSTESGVGRVNTVNKTSTGEHGYN